MKRASQRHLPVYVNQVSVTALMDLVLIILLVFIVAVPLLRRQKTLSKLPPMAVVEPQSSVSPIELKIQPDQSILLAGKAVTGDALLPALKALLLTQPESGVLVKMPANFAAGALAKLMDEMHRAGVKKTAVEVVEPPVLTVPAPKR